MTFGQAVASGFANYANFNGRASRSGYWYWVLFHFLANIPFVIFFGVALGIAIASGATTADRNIDPATLPLLVVASVLLGLVQLALFIPSIALEVRRLHDINFSGAWWWIQLVPSVGSIILLVFMFLPSVDEGNRYN